MGKPKQPEAPVALTLTTGRQAPHQVQIDGQRYALRWRDELSVQDRSRLEGLRPRVAELEARLGTLSDPELGEYIAAIRFASSVMLAAPADVQAKLSDAQVALVLEAFATMNLGIA